MVSDKDKDALERKVFPSEVSILISPTQLCVEQCISSPFLSSLEFIGLVPPNILSCFHAVSLVISALRLKAHLRLDHPTAILPCRRMYWDYMMPLDFAHRFFFQARERLTSYRGRMMAKLCWRVNDGPVETEHRDCGLLPIMVRVRFPI